MQGSLWSVSPDGLSSKTSDSCSPSVEAVHTLWSRAISELLATGSDDLCYAAPRRLVRPTGGRGSGLWPTVTAAEKGSDEMMRGNLTPNGAARGTADTMESQVRQWSTPRTTDTNGPGEHGDGGPDLRTAAAAAFGTTGAPSPAPTAPCDASPPKPWNTPNAALATTRKQVFARKGSLNPAFALALMGYPPAWFQIGVAMPKASRRAGQLRAMSPIALGCSGER